MLVGVQGVAAGAVDKFMDGGVEALLIGTAYEEDGAIFQDSLRNLIARVADAIGDLSGSYRPNFFRGSACHFQLGGARSDNKNSAGRY